MWFFLHKEVSFVRTFAPAPVPDQVPQERQDALRPPATVPARVAGAEVDQEVEGGVDGHQQVVEGHQELEPLGKQEKYDR